jgi:hypothetical protein
MGKHREGVTTQTWVKGVFSDNKSVELSSSLVNKAREVFVHSNYSGSGLMTRGEFVDAMRTLEVDKAMNQNFTSFCSLAFGVYSTDEIFLTFREFALLVNDVAAKHPLMFASL